MQRVELGEVEYDVAAKDMRGWVEERIEGKAEDRLFLLSHPAVITYGPRTSPDDLPAGTPAIAVDAPGQPVLGVHRRDHRIDLLRRPSDHRLTR